MIKRIILSLTAISCLWLVFIWAKYHFFYTSYSQKEISSIFEKEKLKAPVYDSIDLRGYSVHYLTNKANDEVTPNQETGKRKPYLFLIHDSGKNSNYFLNYFKNKELNKVFHIIAVDRIGFGKTYLTKSENENSVFAREEKEFGDKADYVTSIMANEILKKEGQHLEEVRIVTTGCSGLLGLKEYSWANLSVVKVFMFYPETEPRFFGSVFFSKLISSPLLSFVFPRAFVSKQKDLLLLDSSKGKDRKMLKENAKTSENKVINSEGSMYSGASTAKEFKSIFFVVPNNKTKEQVEEMIGSNNFYVEDAEKKNIYTNPEFVLEKILINDAYTLNFNRIKR